MPVNPIIIKVGFIQVTYYSLVYLICAFLIFLVLLRASKKKLLPIKKEQVYDFTILLIFSTIIFSRIFDILFWDLSYFKANPSEIIKIWHGGMSFHGGLFGAFLASLFYTRRYKIPFLKLADILIIPFTLALALGRIANFINQEIPGTLTQSKLCITFQYLQGCRHPVQLYASAGYFLLFMLLLFLNSKKQKQGALFLIFLLLASMGRFFLDFVREDVLHLGLKAGQWFSVLTLLIILVIYLKRRTTFYFSRP